MSIMSSYTLSMLTVHGYEIKVFNVVIYSHPVDKYTSRHGIYKYTYVYIYTGTPKLNT